MILYNHFMLLLQLKPFAESLHFSQNCNSSSPHRTKNMVLGGHKIQSFVLVKLQRVVYLFVYHFVYIFI